MTVGTFAETEQIITGAADPGPLVIIAPETLSGTAFGDAYNEIDVGASLVETNAVASETFTITLSASNGTFVDEGTGVDITGYETSLMTITGSLNNVNSNLMSYVAFYASSSYYEGGITLTASDSYGNVAVPQMIDITYTRLPCFTAGTLITTPDGQVPVEHLMIGDLVTVQSCPAPFRSSIIE